MEDDGNSSNNTNDKNDTVEIMQGGETSHIIKNDATRTNWVLPWAAGGPGGRQALGLGDENI